MKRLIYPLCAITAATLMIWFAVSQQPSGSPMGIAPKTKSPAVEQRGSAFESGEVEIDQSATTFPDARSVEVDLSQHEVTPVSLFETGVGDIRPAPEPRTQGGEPAGVAAGMQVGETRTVDFLMDESTRSRLTPREQADQLRDWLLLTIVSDTGLTADEINRVLFDVPPVRHGHMRPIANFEYGVTRSCYIGDGTVVAVVPQSTAEERRDQLAHIADEHRKNLGEQPGRVMVFEYELETDKALGSMTRLVDIAGAELFSADYGYHEAAVRDLRNFERFMERVDDVTYVNLVSSLATGSSGVGDYLVLGGRRPEARSYRGLRVEDVAAVWQAQRKLLRQMEEVQTQFEREHEALKREWHAKLNELNTNQQLVAVPRVPGVNPQGEIVDPYGRVGDEDLSRLWRDIPSAQRPDRPIWHEPGLGSSYTPRTQAQYNLAANRLQAGYEEAAENLVYEQQQRLAKMGLSDGTGFSLDPTFDFEGLAEWFEDEIVEKLEQIAGEPMPQEAIDEIKCVVADGEVMPLMLLLGLLVEEEPSLDEELSQQLQSFRMQTARYIGDLRGTEVGMILFYTDLLAKMWVGLDYDAPKDEIEGFLTIPDGGLPPFYKEEFLQIPPRPCSARRIERS